MAYDFKTLQKNIDDTKEWLKSELSTIQTGRANPSMVDSVLVDSYGTKVQIKEVGSVSVEDARTLRITPWDTDSIRSIEVALRDADLGFGISSDEVGVRVAFPELTTETREKYIKSVHSKLEEARISIRGIRDDVWNDIQKMEKGGEVGKDEKFNLKEKMEEIVKKGNSKLEEVAEHREKEIRG